jgi:hypothetical protein
MKALATLGFAVAAIGLSPVALAETDVTAHADTAAALKCLLDHGQNGCREGFAGSARPAAQFWVWWTPEKDFKLGALVSSEYARTESPNAYITKFLNGRTADVYDVKFAHEKKTFYIVPPGPDGKVHYMNVRDGAPDDEKIYLFAASP